MKYKALYSIPVFTVLTMLAQWSFAGGAAVTGAGEAIGSWSVSKNEIADYLRKSKIPTRYALRGVEFVLLMSKTTQQYEQRLTAKLFSGEKNVYTELARANYNILPSGACKDKDGKDVEASFTPGAKSSRGSDFDSGPTFCFSLELLEKRLTNDNVDREIVALVSHETAHAVGIDDEADAKLFQTWVKAMANQQIFSRIEYEVKDFRSELTEVTNQINMLIQLISTKTSNSNMVCAAVSSTSNAAAKVLAKALAGLNTTGTTYVRPAQIGTLMAITAKSINSLRYCMSGYTGYQKMDQVFAGRKEMSLLEFSNGVWPENKDSTKFPIAEGKIRNIKIGDKVTLKKELQDIITALAQVAAGIQ